jgi:DNA-binding transcriptional LysR family regulator
MFDLKQIQCFVAVGEELHFGRAAKRMFMTQPPLSRQIRLLEHELQLQLFIRNNRFVHLTPAGAVFLREARRLLSLADNAALAAQRIARGEAGLLHLGFTAGSSYSFLPKMLAQINTSLAHVEIVLHEMVTSLQFEALHAHTIDAGLLRPSPEIDDFESICVAREPMMLAVPRNHRLATGSMPSIKDLRDEPFITYNPQDGQYFYELIERLFHDANVSPSYVQHISQIHSILALVSARQGIALVPESARALHFDATVIRKMKMQPVFAELFLAWKTDNEKPALPYLRDLAIKYFAIAPSKTELTPLRSPLPHDP